MKSWLRTKAVPQAVDLLNRFSPCHAMRDLRIAARRCRIREVRLGANKMLRRLSRPVIEARDARVMPSMPPLTIGVLERWRALRVDDHAAIRPLAALPAFVRIAADALVRGNGSESMFRR
jgi:hypothetical protein